MSRKFEIEPEYRLPDYQVHQERYAGPIHVLVVVVCIGLTAWSFPSQRELAGLLSRSNLGNTALIEAYRELDELSEDADQLERARIFRRLGIAQGLTGRLEEMLSSFRKSIDTAPKWLSGRLSLADALRTLARLEDEVPVLQAAQALADEILKMPQGQQRSALADFRFSRVSPPPSFPALKQALGQDLLPWRRRLATSLDFSQQLHRAIPQYRRILRDDPRNVATAVRLVQLLFQEGQFEEACTALETALSNIQLVHAGKENLATRFAAVADPGRRRILRALLAGWHLRQPSPSDAPLAIALGFPVPTWTWSRESTSADEVAVLDGIRVASLVRQEATGQLDLLRRTLELEPGDQGLKLRLAQELEALGDLVGALALYRELREASNDPVAHAEEITRILVLMGNMPDLMLELELQYRQQPDLEKGLALARQFYAIERFDDAARMYRELAEQHQDNLELLASLASVLRMQDRHKEAIEVLRQVLERLPDSSGSGYRKQAASEPEGGVTSPLAPILAGRSEGAEGPPSGDRLIKRRVLALFSGAAETSAETTRLHERIEIAFNYHGLILEYRDISEGLPDDEEMEAFAGVVSWFHWPTYSGASEYLAWLGRQVDGGRKLVFLGGIGALLEQKTAAPVPLRQLNRFLNKIGMEHDGFFRSGGPDISITQLDSKLMQFERKLGRELGYFEGIRSIDPANQVLLSLELATPGASPRRGDVAVLSQAALYVSPTYTDFQDTLTRRRQLRIDAFELLGSLFGAEQLPVPDPSTINGRRTAMIHLDGDGARNATVMEGYKDCLDVLLERFFKTYAVEQTVSFISVEVDPERPGTESLRERAKQLYEFPWIEPASHSYSHPFDWQDTETSAERAERHKYEYGDIPFRRDREIRQATELILDLAPSRDIPKVLLWSGACNPSESQLQFTTSVGVINMNGGDGRFDGEYPSVTALSPWIRSVGEQRQYLTPQANEYYLSANDSLPLWSFIRLAESWDRSESPRRLKPMGLYYHHYIVRDQGGTTILEKLYEKLLGSTPAIVPASEFIAQLQGFDSLRMTRKEDGRIAIEDAGRCLTLRLPLEMGVPDLSRSEGIAGYLLEKDHHYVHLIPGDKQLLALGTGPGSPDVFLESANLRMEDWRREANLLVAHFRGHGDAFITLGGKWISPGLDIQFRDESGLLMPLETTTGPTGTLLIESQARGRMELELVRR